MLNYKNNNYNIKIINNLRKLNPNHQKNKANQFNKLLSSNNRNL